MTFWKQTPKLLSKLKTDGSLNQILEKNDHDTISSKSFDTGEIKAFVESGAAYIKDVGRDKALTEFSKKQGKFSKSELYIFCISMEGTTLAHVDPRQIGASVVHLKDKLGFPFIQEFIRVAKQGHGWVEYWWENPVTKNIQPKITYIQKVGPDLFIGSGIYK